MRRTPRPIKSLRIFAVTVVVAMLSLMTPQTDAAALQAANIVINEVVAANDSFVDSFGDTPDWIELQNNGGVDIDLGGWSISDNGGRWDIPSVTIDAGDRLIIFASGRDVTTPELHTDFALQRSGETVTLADANGLLVDTLVYTALADDQAYGRGLSGGTGYLIDDTPGAPNTELAPSIVTITTPPTTFVNPISISIAAAGPGEQVRYTLDGNAVTTSSPLYTGAFTISTSTVVRAAAVRNGDVGPESSAGYIAISSSIASFTSDLPIVLVHSTGAVENTDQDAIVSVIDRDPVTGRASVTGPADYNGFAGLRIRGESSANFAKKQYKFETWGNRLGTEIDVDILGLGSDSDWVLYGPGPIDRGMINNAFMYELGARLGVSAPDYQFVELYIEDNASGSIGDSDYLGLYLLRESIKIDSERVDITKHTPTSAGADGGYIVRYDWNDSCCTNLEQHPEFPSYINVDSPNAANLTTAQRDYIGDWWNDVQAASKTSFTAADQLIDFDSFIDHWLLEILAMDVDVLRASHFMHLDANGQLQGGPLWDYDRSLGAADFRVDDLVDAQRWDPNGNSGHTYLSDIYADLWTMPEIQARLRARWAELRSTNFSDAAISGLINDMGSEISEVHVRDDNRWTEWDPRFGGGLQGELDHMIEWLDVRMEWLDDQWLSNSSPPVITVPGGGVEFQENAAVTYQVQATDAQTMVYSAVGLPDGLSINESTGLISGTVAYGDVYQSYPVDITVVDSSGASATAQILFFADSTYDLAPGAVLLNEYNAVGPGAFLRDNGSDSNLGRVSGNGGDWFEIVTLDDQLDMRGWKFDLWDSNATNAVTQTASLVLGQDDVLSNVRAGSIITVAESIPEDLSYDPGNDDWTLNLQSNNAQQGSLWANQTNFDTNHKKWRLVVRDSSNTIRAIVNGETAAWTEGLQLNLSSDEVMALAADPGLGFVGTSYAQTPASSFGEPNPIDAAGTLQDFSALRPTITLPGDVNCSDEVTVIDALMIAQFAVGLRTDSGGCPLGDPLTELNTTGGDVNDDAEANYLDALLIAQCGAGLTNEYCPD